MGSVHQVTDGCEEGLREQSVEPVLDFVLKGEGAELFGDFGQIGLRGGLAIGLAQRMP